MGRVESVRPGQVGVELWTGVARETGRGLRGSTQPYLAEVEKKWIAFQLLTALRGARQRKVGLPSSFTARSSPWVTER